MLLDEGNYTGLVGLRWEDQVPDAVRGQGWARLLRPSSHKALLALWIIEIIAQFLVS